MKHKKRNIILIILSIIVILLITFLLYVNFLVAPYIEDIEITESKSDETKSIFNVYIKNNFFKLNKDSWCIVTTDNNDTPTKTDSRWIKSSNGYCSYMIENGNYNVYIKDKYGNIADLKSQKVNINKIIDVKFNKENVYLYKDGTEKITYNLDTIGNLKVDSKLISKNENIATIDDAGIITGKNYGTTEIVVESDGKTYGSLKVTVTSFITKPKVDTSKPYVTCRQFSTEEAELLDNILFDRINEAGYGTRAGVVAAARFLTLEFSYRIHYFYENGRLTESPYKIVDGEGRYYHRGLYLSENKFSSLQPGAKLVGPAIWGCDLQNYTNWGQWVVGKYYPNGLDCSGFVTWALLNGGFDVGDRGAGPSSYEDVDDLGTKVTITEELMSSGKVKVGDLIGLYGHAAILAGWDDENYYIAESLNTTKGVVMTVVKKEDLVNNSIYTFIILMDDVYKNDGNLTNYWE